MHLLIVAAMLAAPAELDTPLHAVQFVDRNEGWAGGADGVLWHTIDAGATWERQPLPTRGTIHAIKFLTPYYGYVAGREEVQATGGSHGVLFVTRDGGVTWSRLGAGALPGLHGIHFVDDRRGFAFGSGTDRSPSGVFQTLDGGVNWQPVAGPRASWRGEAGGRVLVGCDGRVATLRDRSIALSEADVPPGRCVRAVAADGDTVVAVGQGGLVLISRDSGRSFTFGELPMPADLVAAMDFRAVTVREGRVHIVGRPGSIVLTSGDAGKTWALQPTGQGTGLNALAFVDASHGWAVGDLGAILATTDGGATWTRQQGGYRPAVLCIHAMPKSVPIDLIARMGRADGYRVAVLVGDGRGETEMKLAAAVRKSGGAALDTLNNFDLPSHLESADREALLKHWNKSHSGRAMEELTGRLALALRTWQPEVVICDFAGGPAESLFNDAMMAAIAQSADADRHLPARLDAATVKKLFCHWDGPGMPHLAVATTEPLPGSAESPRDLATRIVGLLGETAALPKQRGLRLLYSTIPREQALGSIGDGLTIPHGGPARRTVELATGPAPDMEARNLIALAQANLPGVGDPGTVLPRLQAAIGKMPEEQAANALTVLARQYARSGQWDLARETYSIALERYAGQPAGVESLRWLVRYQASSEARRRYEMKQTVGLSRVEFSSITGEKESYANNGGVKPLAEAKTSQHLAVMSDPKAARAWYQSALGFEAKLPAQGPAMVDDPAVQFPLIAAKRQLGDVDSGKSWMRRFVGEQAGQGDADAWRECARQELWVTERLGPPPRFAAQCRKTSARPKLDGQFDDECWRDLVPVVLKPTDESHRSTARFAYDDEYLYVAIECAHPESGYRPTEPRRGRDADVGKHDRVELILDMDRDYATYYRFRVDQRGAAADDCWGDATWNPVWYIATTSTKAGYTIELAIRLMDLTGDPIPPGKAWSMNLVRVAPGQGIYAGAYPADVAPKPEGAGLLFFVDTSRK